MSSLTRVLASRFALGAALAASACQHDSNVIFDDGSLKSPDAGGSGATNNGGSDAAAGADTSGSSSSGSGGSSNQGGKATAGSVGSGQAGGKASGGNGGGGGGGGGGKAGFDAGGSTSQGGKIGQGGKAGSASAGGGVGGSANPEPVTVETTEIADTEVGSCMPNANHGEAESMTVDGALGCSSQILINAPLTLVPDGALVSAATLTLTCTDPGGPITVSYVNEVWDELTVRWNNRPNMGMMLDTVTCAESGEITIDLTRAVTAWLAGDHKPNGIYLHSVSTDGTDFDTSESADVGSRPKLSVTYTLPIK